MASARENEYDSWGLTHYSGATCFFLDLYSSCVSVFGILKSVQTLAVAFVAIGAPCFFFFYRESDGNELSFNMNWTLISIAVLFPLTMSVTSAFARRERAIQDLAVLNANLISIFLAHRDWDWGTPGKNRASQLPPTHVGLMAQEVATLIGTITRLLQAPNVNKARHDFTAAGRRDCTRVQKQMDLLDSQIQGHFGQMSIFVEDLKRAGLPGNEASRIRQYFTVALSAYVHLRSIKSYRTPQGIRTFARIFILLTPIVMGPYYAYLAGAGDSDGVGLPFACFFSFLASMSMQGLFAVRLKMEDPFSDGERKAGRDTIDLDRHFGALNRLVRKELPIESSQGEGNTSEGVATKYTVV